MFSNGIQRLSVVRNSGVPPVRRLRWLCRILGRAFACSCLWRCLLEIKFNKAFVNFCSFELIPTQNPVFVFVNHREEVVGLFFRHTHLGSSSHHFLLVQLPVVITIKEVKELFQIVRGLLLGVLSMITSIWECIFGLSKRGGGCNC